MDPVRVLSSVLIFLSLVAIGVGAGYAWHGAEVSDNVCGPTEIRDCAGRDARAERFESAGMTMIIGGFSLMAVSAVLFTVPSWKRAPADA